MSNWRENLETDEQAQEAFEWLTEYYHYPVLIFLVGFAFWNRVRNYSNFIIDGEIFYAGNDPWYHMRSSEYVVQSYPETMPFDPWTNFPEGAFVAQFGTLFDQIIGLMALIVGLGTPSQYTTRLVILLSPALFGVAVMIPLYFIGKRLGGRFGGITAVSFVALAPDRLLRVSLAGHVQHHSLEVILMSLTILGLMVALTAANREKPVYEIIRIGEYRTLRGTIGWSLLAGVALGTYIWAWPPGIWLYGILGVFFLLHLSIEHVRGRSPEHPAIVGVITLGTAVIMQLAIFRSVAIEPTGRSLLQPGLGLVVILGIVFLAWLSREYDRRDVTPLGYPATVAGTLAAVAVLMALLLPGMFDFFVGQMDRVFGFFTDAGGAAGTIGEGHGADSDDIFDFYRFAMFTALLGGVLLLARHVLDENPSGEQLLIVVWAIFMVMATFTQVRFGYYLAPVVGALNAALVGYVFKLMGTGDRRSLPETYQILTVAVIILVMFVPMLGLPIVGGGETAADMADGASHPGGIIGWSDSLDWMSENTPEPGQYGEPDAEAMEYYGQYTKTDNFEYPVGAYGVLSWWDYGHWITAKGERIANANPFQHHADEAAEFLLAQDEAEAETVMAEEFEDEGGAETRYVMIDSLMVETETGMATDGQFQPIGGKFFAPAEFHEDFERGDFFKHVISDRERLAISHNQAYYEAMMTRLYHYHGSAMEPEPIVMQWSGGVHRADDGAASVQAPDPEVRQDRPLLRFEENMTAAREAVADDPSQQIGGIGAFPEERVEALEHYRLVYMDEKPAIQATGGNDGLWEDSVGHGMNPGPNLRAFQRTVPLFAGAENNPFPEELGQQAQFLYPNTQSYTKTFERVPGATIEGSIDADDVANEVVTLEAELDPENGRIFTYEQQVETDENGDFTAVVPYSTTGYDDWGVDEGYTNVSVRGTGPYEISTEAFEEDGEEYHHFGTVNVTEGQVIGEDEEPVTVTLEQQETPDPLDMIDEEDLPDDFDGEPDDGDEDETDEETGTNGEQDGDDETGDETGAEDDAGDGDDDSDTGDQDAENGETDDENAGEDDDVTDDETDEAESNEE